MCVSLEAAHSLLRLGTGPRHRTSASEKGRRPLGTQGSGTGRGKEARVCPAKGLMFLVSVGFYFFFFSEPRKFNLESSIDFCLLECS